MAVLVALSRRLSFAGATGASKNAVKIALPSALVLSGCVYGGLAMAALITLLVVVLGFTVYCLVDLARAEEFRYLDRETWALICLVSLPLGGIIYLAVGRRWKVRDPGSAPR
jgi:hypothetical protein